MKKPMLFVVALLVVVVGFFVAARTVEQRRTERLDFMAHERASTFVRPHSPVFGDDAAKVYVVEFTDPACETCAAFAPLLKDFVARRYPGKVKLVIRWAPFHTGAPDAVRILEAARLQGKLWETLHRLFETQESWTVQHQVDVERIWPLLQPLGLDEARLRTDMNDPRIAKIVEQDLADVQALGVHQTPGIFVNGKPLEPFGVEPLAALIAAEVEAKYPQ